MRREQLKRLFGSLRFYLMGIREKWAPGQARGDGLVIPAPGQARGDSLVIPAPSGGAPVIPAPSGDTPVIPAPGGGAPVIPASGGDDTSVIQALSRNPFLFPKTLSWLLIILLSLMVAVSQASTLTGFAVLSADTFIPGPTSGQFISAANGRLPPFNDQQPVQGFSALVKAEENAYFILSDNGFGRRDNSADYLLSIYHVTPHFRTQNGGSGKITLNNVIHLSDPQRLLPYPASRPTDRRLTGADLDPESLRLGANGSFWIGEEFNPSLLHFNSKGELLAAPFKLEGLASKDNPGGAAASLPRSRGFEGLGSSPDGKLLYPMLEGALNDSDRGLNIYTFDVGAQAFVNPDAEHPSFRYRLDKGATAIGSFTMFSDKGGLVIERDSAQGQAALIKKIYRINFGHVDTDGFMTKTLVADLLNIDDPHDLNQDGCLLFRFPFWTIEGLVVINPTTLGIVNDNNYPFDHARDKMGESPDNSEFIRIDVDPLWDRTKGYNDPTPVNP